MSDPNATPPAAPAPIAVAPPQQALSAFSSAETFAAAQRMARCLASADLVPESYRGEKGLPNAVIALEMAQRIGAPILMVMQSLHVIHGRPSWSATFIIGAIASSGRFSPMRFRMTGAGDDRTCVAWATDKTGETLESPPVSIGMAKAEGWYGKNGSKWKTMPELMLRYRAATLFGRLYAPDILMGMGEVEEALDIAPARIGPEAAIPVGPPIQPAVLRNPVRESEEVVG